MNNLNDTDHPSALILHAVAQATAHAQGHEVRCRRWRRMAAVLLAVVMLLLLVATLALTDSVSAAVTHSPQATGALPTDEAVADVLQMLQNQ